MSITDTFLPERVDEDAQADGPQRQVAAKALAAITGEGFGYDPAADRAANRAAVRRAELWYLKNR